MEPHSTIQRLIPTSIGIVSWQNWAHQEVTSFVQVSRTITFTYASSLPTGSRLRSLEISGIPVPRASKTNDDKKYIISTIDFVANGGDGFLYPSKKASAPMKNLEEVLADYVTEKSPFQPVLDGRISKLESEGSLLDQQVVDGDRRKVCYGARCRGGR